MFVNGVLNTVSSFGATPKPLKKKIRAPRASLRSIKMLQQLLRVKKYSRYRTKKKSLTQYYSNMKKIVQSTWWRIYICGNAWENDNSYNWKLICIFCSTKIKPWLKNDWTFFCMLVVEPPSMNLFSVAICANLGPWLWVKFHHVLSIHKKIKKKMWRLCSYTFLDGSNQSCFSKTT